MGHTSTQGGCPAGQARKSELFAAESTVVASGSAVRPCQGGAEPGFSPGGLVLEVACAGGPEEPWCYGRQVLSSTLTVLLL